MREAVAILAVAAIVAFGAVPAFAAWPFPDEPAQADPIQHGANYDVEEISHNVFQWTSKPERLPVNGKWVDFRYQDEPTYFTFESANGAVTISKTDCSIKMMEPGFVQSGETPVINSITQIVKEAKNGTDIWSVHPVNDRSCEFSYTKNDSGIQAVLTKQDMLFGMGKKFETIYDIDYSGRIKTTFKYLNADPVKSDHKYGFTQIFNGNFDVQIGNDHYSTINGNAEITKEQMEGKAITITGNGVGITYDTDNDIHRYLWMVKIRNGSMVFDFTYSKGALPVGEQLVIDPTFGYTAALHFYVTTTGATASCATTTGGTKSNAQNLWILKRDTTQAVNSCVVSMPRWNIVSIPDSSHILDVSIKYDVQSVSSPNKCNWNSMQFDPNGSTDAQQLYLDAFNGTTFVSDSTQCQTVANDKILDLGSSADINLQSFLPQNFWAVGIVTANQTRDASGHEVVSDNSGTYLIELQVTYALIPTSYELKPFQNDGTTVIGSGTLINSNATVTESSIINSTGWAKSTGLSSEAAYNFTVKDALDNFVVNQTINKRIYTNLAQTGTTNIFPVDCGGVDTDFQVKANFTSYHTMTSTTPSCNSDGDISFTTTDTKRGLGPSTNQTRDVIARIIDTAEYTWLPGKMTANGTQITGTYLTNVVNFTDVQIGNGYNTRVMNYVITTDNVTAQPTALTATPVSETRINLSWTAPASNHGDSIYSYRIWRDGTIYQNSTGTAATSYSDTSAGPAATSHTYQVCAWNRMGCSPYSNTATAATIQRTAGTISLATGNIGDVVNINATITVTAGAPSPFTVQDVRLYDNNTLVYTNTTDMTISAVNGTAFSRIWYQITNDALNIFHVQATLTNSSGTVNFSSTNSNVTREYDPGYLNADDNPTVEGLVNYTISRFDSEDGILLHVNRMGGSLGTTWTLNCITQTNAEAQATRNQSLNWPGTWRNFTDTGYGNMTWTDFRNTQGYVTCFNPPGQLFTTISYTNSSLALFGIAVFDDSYGAMLGVPVGIFFLALAGGMANKRTAPTWIVVLLGMAGVMATIGFFTISPVVWGLALVTGLMGLLVNQKVF